MDPDLMSSAGVQHQAHQGAALPRFHHFIVGAGKFPVLADHLLHQRAGFRPQGRLYRSHRRLQNPFTHRQILPAEAVGVELLLQHLLGMGVAGHHQQAGGPPVQAVDGVKIPLCSLLIVIIEEIIPNSIGIVPRAGVDRHAGCFIEHHHVPILIDDIQGAWCGQNSAAPLGVRQPHRQHLPLLGTEPGVHPRPVHQDAVLQPFDPPHHRPGQPQMTLEQGIHLDSRQRPGDGQLQPPRTHSFRDSPNWPPRNSSTYTAMEHSSTVTSRRSTATSTKAARA